MKKFAKNVLGIATVCTLLISSAVWAQQSGNVNPDRKGGNRQMRGNAGVRQRKDGFGMRINWAELNLTEEQKTQMQEKRREFQVDTAELQQKMRFARQDLGTAMRQDPIDQASVDSKWAEISALQQQLGEAETEHMLALRSILTQEQLEALQKSRETRQELQELKTEYRDLLLSPGEIDAATLKQLQAQITEKELALQKERTENRAERFQALTPEQQQQLQSDRRGRRKR